MGWGTEMGSAALRAGQVTVFAWTVALAGFLFGFDVSVISGAEQAIQTGWGLSPSIHGLILSAALWGTVVGALGGAIPTDRLGRRGALMCVAFGYLIASVGSALAAGPVSFAISRFIGGLAIGVSSIAAPAYITEIAPAERRGRLVGLYQFNIVGGILIAYLSNWLIGQMDSPNSWRWMLGIQALPSAIFLLALRFIPDSPAAREILQERPEPQAWRDFLTGSLRRPAVLAFAIALFNQMSGINAVIYFAPRIFEEAGLGKDAALLASVGVGVANFLATGMAVRVIDQLGRRTLMLIGSAGYCATLGGLALAFALGSTDLVAPLVFLFIVAHAVGQGAVIWVFLAEIFPTKARARGQAIGSGTHWLLAALVTMALPPALSAFSPATVFAFFFAMMLGQWAWVIHAMPETKGKAID